MYSNVSIPLKLMWNSAIYFQVLKTWLNYLNLDKNPWKLELISTIENKRHLLHLSYIFCVQVSSPKDDELETDLKFLSNEDKTVIIAILNESHTEKGGLLDLFLRGQRGGIETDHLIDRILFVAVDQVAFGRCTEMLLNCYKLERSSRDLSRGVVNKEDGFVENIWIKSYFLGMVLKRGYSFVFTVRHGCEKFKFLQDIINMIEILKERKHVRGSLHW